MARPVRVSRMAIACFVLLNACGRIAETGADADLDRDGATITDAATTSDSMTTTPDAAPSGPDASSATCDRIWNVSTGNSLANARIDHGALVLTDPGGDASGTCDPSGPCYPVSVYQDGLAGDFDAHVRFEDFASDGPFSRVALFVATGSGHDAIAMASMRFSSASANNLSVTLPQENTGTWSNSHAGTLTIERRGSQLTVYASDGPHATQLQGVFAEGAVRIGVMVESQSSSIPTSARITEFTVLNSGDAVQSDSFECDSLR